MAKFDPTRTPGAIGIAPPAGAPHEVTTPGSERALPEQIAQARRNEVDQPVYAPKPMTVEQMAQYLGKSVDEIKAIQQSGGVALAPPAVPAAAVILTDAPTVPTPPPHPPPPTPPPPPPPAAVPAASTLRRVSKPMPSVSAIAVESTPIEETAGEMFRANANPEDVAPIEEPAPALPPATVTEPALPPILPHQRAGSNSDSPSRGVPQPIADPGKRVTGGFGDVGEAQYFALDGIELRRVIDSLLTELQRRIADDLRFSMAATYPRVNARVAIEVSCYGNDSSFQIVNHYVKEKTPIEIARRHAEECCFVIQAEHVEMTESGESVTPPDKIRLELGLPVPRKQAVQTPGGRMIVDLKQ